VNTVRLQVELSPAETLALAQLVKRICFSTFLEYSIDETEAHLMLDAGERVREALAEQGYSPR
jgi:hypothetical protein